MERSYSLSIDSYRLLEGMGHQWHCATAFYNVTAERLIVCEDEPMRPCEHCGMAFIEFITAMQSGTMLACSRMIDGVTVSGPVS